VLQDDLPRANTAPYYHHYYDYYYYHILAL
jgi:hypothetical protein